jgi:hypothetical protein
MNGETPGFRTSRAESSAGSDTNAHAAGRHRRPDTAADIYAHFYMDLQLNAPPGARASVASFASDRNRVTMAAGMEAGRYSKPFGGCRCHNAENGPSRCLVGRPGRA